MKRMHWRGLAVLLTAAVLACCLWLTPLSFTRSQEEAPTGPAEEIDIAVCEEEPAAEALEPETEPVTEPETEAQTEAPEPTEPELTQAITPLDAPFMPLLAIDGSLLISLTARVSHNGGDSFDAWATGDPLPVPVEPGEVMEYQITLENTTDEAIGGITVTMLLPAGLAFQSATPTGGAATSTEGERVRVTWTGQSLAANASFHYTIRVQAFYFEEYTPFDATARVLAGDIDETSNETRHYGDPQPPPTIFKEGRVSKDNGATWSAWETGASTIKVRPGDLLEYSLTMHNPRDVNIVGVPPPYMVDLLPFGMQLVSTRCVNEAESGAAYTVELEGLRTKVTWFFEQLPPGDTVVYIISQVSF